MTVRPISDMEREGYLIAAAVRRFGGVHADGCTRSETPKGQPPACSCGLHQWMSHAEDYARRVSALAEAETPADG